MPLSFSTNNNEPISFKHFDVSSVNSSIATLNTEVTTLNSEVAAINIEIERLQDVIAVPNATVDGVTDDTAAINSTIAALGAAGGGVVQLEPGTYALAGGSSHVTVDTDNVWLRGSGKGITILKLLNACTEDIVKIFSGGTLNNCGVSDLTIDAGSFATASHGAVNLNTVVDGFVRNVSVINQGVSGITVQGCTRFDISDNDTSLNTAVNTQNHGILVAASTQNTDGIIARNRCKKSGTIFSGTKLRIMDNYVTDWKYGSGITIGPDAFTHDNTISNNVCTGGTGVDVDVTYCAGYELWSPRSTVTGNTASGNSGNGIMLGGDSMVCTGNLSYENGQSAHSGDTYGIFAQTDGGSNVANNCTISGNRCYSSGTQTHGYAEASGLSSNILSGNNFNGNTTGPINFTNLAATTVIDGYNKPNTQTAATYSVVPSDRAIIANRAGTVTLTLLSAALYPARQLIVTTIQAQTVVSASSNVVPLVGGSAGTAILAATAGKWALLESDGTNWVIVAGA